MKLIQSFQKVYRSSLLGIVGDKISKAYRSSRIFSLNKAGDLDGVFAHSVLISNREKTSESNPGIILSSVRRLMEQLLHISLGEFAFLMFFWSLASGCSALMDRNFTTAIFMGVSSAVFLALCFVRASVRNILCGSFVGRFFAWDFSAPAQKQNKILMAFLGILAIVGGMFLPFTYSAVVPLIPVALFLLVYAKPIFFIAVIMFCLPIFGTSICIVLSVLLIISHLFQRLLGTVKKQPIDYVDILLAVFMILCLVASLFSFTMADSFRISLMWIILFSIVFLIYRHIQKLKDLITVIVGLFLGGLVSCGVGLAQYFSGQIDTTWTDTELFEDLSIRIYGTFANPNVFGEFLLLMIPLAVGLCLYFKEWKYKVACCVISLISFVTLALTYSRGCYVGIAVTAVVFLWMYSKKILGALLVIGTPIGIMMLPQNMIDRIASMVNFADSSTSYRLKIYQGTLGMLGKYWQSGVGIGEDAFNFVYPFFGVQGIVAPHSHSLFLQLFVSFGIAGFAYFLIMMFLYHRNIISLMHMTSSDCKSKVLLITFGSIMFGFLVQSIFDYTWYNYRVYMLFWIVFALGLATYRILKRERGAI